MWRKEVFLMQELQICQLLSPLEICDKPQFLTRVADVLYDAIWSCFEMFSVYTLYNVKCEW